MEEPPLSFLHSSIAPVERTRNHLPHWQREGLLHFITFRLADSLPQSLIEELHQQKLAKSSKYRNLLTPEVEQTIHLQFTRKLEALLDQNLGRCILRTPAILQIVADALQHFEGKRCKQIAWVIMPNHVHVLCQLLDQESLAKLVRSWKSYTSRKINELQPQAQPHEGALWQKDYFDRAIRDEEHLTNCIRYIRKNPSKAKLRDDEYRCWESDFAREMAKAS